MPARDRCSLGRPTSTSRKVPDFDRRRDSRNVNFLLLQSGSDHVEGVVSASPTLNPGSALARVAEMGRHLRVPTFDSVVPGGRRLV